MTEAPAMSFEFAFPFTLWQRLKANAVLIPTRAFSAFFYLGMPALGVLALLFILGGSSESDRTDWLPYAIFLVILPFCAVLGIAISYAFNPVMREPFRYVIDDGGVHILSRSYDYTHHWSTISRATRRAGFFMLFFRPGCAHCLPLSAIRAAGQEEHLAAFLRTKGIPVT